MKEKQIKDENYYLDRIKLGKITLDKVKEQYKTNKVCMAAVRADGLNLKYIENQTKQICLAAVRQNGVALDFVKNQTYEICLAAIKELPTAFTLIKNQTEEICLAAVRNWSGALKYVENQTEEICLAALKSACAQRDYIALVLHDIKNQTEEMCMLAIKEDPMSIRGVKNQTEEICLAAIKSEASSFMFINENSQSEKVCLAALKADVGLFFVIREKNYTDNIINYVFRTDKSVIKFIKNQTEEICLDAVKNNWELFKYCKIKSKNVYAEAFKRSPVAIAYVGDDYKYNRKEIDAAYAELVSKKKKYNNVVFVDFTIKLIEILSNLNDNDLIKAFDNHKIILNDKKSVKEIPGLKNFNEKVKMLKMVGFDKTHKPKNNKKII